MKLSLGRLLLGVLLGVLVYGAVVAFSGYRAVRASLEDFGWSGFAAAIALASCNYGLRFAKWQYYLRRLAIDHVPAGPSSLIFLSGFVLTITPGKLGEVFKSAVLQRTHGVPVERTAPIVLAERLTDVMAIVILVALGSIGFSGGWVWALVGALLVSLGLVLVSWEPPLARLLGWLRRSSRGGRWVPRLERALESLRVVAAPGALLWPVALSVVGWGLEGLGLHLILDGFGQSPAFSFSLFFYATSTLAGAVIPVPGGLGVTEAIMLEQLVHVAGAPTPIATASMLLIRLATLWWAVLVGFVALGCLKLMFPVELDLSRAAPRPEQGPFNPA